MTLFRAAGYACGLLLIAVRLYADSTRPLLPIPTGRSAAVSRPADPERFTFILSGDNRAAARGLPAPPTAARIFEEMAILRPAFALWSGDSIYGSDDSPSEAEGEYDEFLRIAAVAGVPVYNAPGNHEVFERPEMAALYEKRMGRLYGSFDYGKSHFIALNTAEVGFNAGLSPPQLEWLRQDLEANRQASNIFVFMHHPLFPKEKKAGFSDRALRDKLHEMFVKYGVKSVFSGHEHLYFRSVQDGITYWVTGGAGAPTDASPDEGGFQHYLLFSVEGSKVTAVLLQPWRLFCAPAVGPDSQAVVVSNYNIEDLTVYPEFTVPAAGLVAEASWTYKGKTHPLEAVIVPSRTEGHVTVRVEVPGSRAAVIRLRPG